MYKVAILGERESVLGFMALGFSVHEVNSADEAAKTLQALVRAGEYAVIFITERYAMQIEETVNLYKDLPLPAILSVPGFEGSNGYGMNSIKSAVERAVGADILFKNDTGSEDA